MLYNSTQRQVLFCGYMWSGNAEYYHTTRIERIKLINVMVINIIIKLYTIIIIIVIANVVLFLLVYDFVSD